MDSLFAFVSFGTDRFMALDTPAVRYSDPLDTQDPLTAIGPVHLTPLTPGPDSLTCHRKPYGPYKRIGLSLGLLAHTLAITSPQ